MRSGHNKRVSVQDCIGKTLYVQDNANKKHSLGPVTDVYRNTSGNICLVLYEPACGTYPEREFAEKDLQNMLRGKRIESRNGKAIVNGVWTDVRGLTYSINI